jgi:hypothetical protein
MSKNDGKHVQTELTEDEYERFRQFASEQGLSLKEAGRKALIRWIERQQRADPNDPAFTVLDELEETSLSGTAETDARDEDDLVDEWNGDDVAFTLSENPTENQ